jgi:hypothetical protein
MRGWAGLPHIANQTYIFLSQDGVKKVFSNVLQSFWTGDCLSFGVNNFRKTVPRHLKSIGLNQCSTMQYFFSLDKLTAVAHPTVFFSAQLYHIFDKVFKYEKTHRQT